MRAPTTIATLAAALAATLPAGAQTLLDLSGKVQLADGLSPAGTQIRLQVDLDRDGEFGSFETVNATADEDGSYRIEYALDLTDISLDMFAYVSGLLQAYADSGFEALLDGGPLPAVLTFEREGYSTIVRRFATMVATPSLDARLVPLQALQCSTDTCQSPDGRVFVSGFPGGTGIDRAYVQAYEPRADTERFPGNFADSDDHLLISSGFTEIDFRDADGNKVTALSSPVSVRFAVERAAWPTLVDLEVDTGRIEVPMYSFDDATAQWVTEDAGELQDESGAPLEEELLPAIVAGEHQAAVFVAFETSHFSTWNCDRPVRTRTCVKGRVVDRSGTPLPGVQVNVQGVSYTGTNGTVTTGESGWFATDVMKSEESGEDVDNNGEEGETFTARVTASLEAGLYLGEPFETSTLQRAATNRGTPTCLPEDCECPELGDVVAQFEPPRLCEVSVSAVFSGTHRVGAGGPLEADDPVVGARVRGELAGGAELTVAAAEAVCASEQCYAAEVDAAGSATFQVPVVGEDPQIRVRADYETTVDEKLHTYSATITIDGCPAGESAIASQLPLALDHSELSGLAAFIASLGSALSSSSSSSSDSSSSSSERGDNGSADSDDELDSGCQCSAGGSSAPLGELGALLSMGALVLGLSRRRRRWPARG